MPLPRLNQLRAKALSSLALTQLFSAVVVLCATTGDYTNIHPPDKQNPSSRLAKQALAMIYKLPITGWQFPLIANSSVISTTRGKVSVVVDLRGGGAGGPPVNLTDDPPLAATQPSALSGFSLPRNLCVTAGPYTHGGGPFPEYCGYPHIHCSDGSVLNASATIGADKSSIILSAPSSNCTAVATSYGRADWPMTVFFTEGEKGLPVIPWYAAIGVNNSWTPP